MSPVWPPDMILELADEVQKEMKIKERANLQTRNRLGLPDVSFCFSEKIPML